MDAQSSTKPTTVQAQPQAATGMNPMKAPENHTECLNAKANRARGAGAGKNAARSVPGAACRSNPKIVN
ncbi:hypothetical protein HWV62_243 [Athelia sp. TMB]|nr:hypothetical protein HWV62_243 [Athelia sp. TMB]